MKRLWGSLWKEYLIFWLMKVAAGRRFLHALAHKQPLPSLDDADAATRDAIRRMVRYHVVEQDETGVYRFEVPFVERWVRERALLA
ncbi:MAG: hypothetical protein ACPGWR_16420 [Ardenticatenaceae bacterium]